MELQRRVGLTQQGECAALDRATLKRSIALKLAALGYSVSDGMGEAAWLNDAKDLFARYREQSRLLSEHLSPVDRRIQSFLDSMLADCKAEVGDIRVPSTSFILDRYGLARELSLPDGEDSWHNEVVSSYRLGNGVLHNPINDRRTTQGVFHVADCGLRVPADKVAVPKVTYAHLLKAAFEPTPELNQLPFAASWSEPVGTMVSLLLRPLVCPEVPGGASEKRMEVRFFAPGALVSNLDFVESIFGNAGDPFLPENDAALDVEHWTGHSGCVVLAPHLMRLRKKDVGLPHIDDATAAQKATGMCWTRDDEIYNSGAPFKITMRSMDGVMVTILADNYFGYCKKEVKTQIGFSANLYGFAEEEHAGGALAFSTYGLGARFSGGSRMRRGQHRFQEVKELLGDAIDVHPAGYATDKKYPEIHYLPEDMVVDVKLQDISWTFQGEEQHLKLLPGHIYLHPSGFKLRMEKHLAAPTWRLIGTVPEGTFCHKPCTVSGGGKSEISKSLNDAVLYGPIYVSDLEKDLDAVEEILGKDYGQGIYRHERAGDSSAPSRPLLAGDRSLGSVIKLLTPSNVDFSDEYNEWLLSIPNHIRALVFVIKRFFRPEWEDDWRQHFSVDIVNGSHGHELRYDGRKLVGSYLRIGHTSEGAWRTFKLRQDFVSADKVQMEDDISASIVVPKALLYGLPSEYDGHRSLKLSENCEFRLFQRPDDAIYPGFDKQTEKDMSDPGLFASNFQPLRASEMREIEEDASFFSELTEPMQAHVSAAARAEGFGVCSARPRLVNGARTKNPRYLQVRPDVARPRDRYVAEMGARLHRRLPIEKPVVFPVISVLSGRRNNPPQEGIRPLCVYNPLHYQELPELFMDYICSVTGKSPSTTGAGSEGALTKGPFNAITATADLNNTLVSMLLCEYAGFSSAAGYIGPNSKVDHDVSLLIPEIWCRVFPEERDPEMMIAAGHLEKLEDYDHEGKRVLASRLGYRITSTFVHTFLGRIFDNPMSVFTEEILQPEKQDPGIFADGVHNIVEAQQRAAQAYFRDGTVEFACPPLRALLHIMAHGQYDGMTVSDPEFRAMFTREALLGSKWYAERLRIKQNRDVALWRRHVESLERFLALPGHREEAQRLGIDERLLYARRELTRVSRETYLADLAGTIGADPIEGFASASSEQSRAAE